MPRPSEIATLVVDGQIFSQWTSVRVTVPCGTEVFSSFDFIACEGDADAPSLILGQVSNKLNAGSATSALARKVKNGAACQVYLAGIKVIDGYVIIRDASLSAGDHTVILQGASALVDIVHGAPKPQEYKGGYALAPIINSMLQGFQGISFIPPDGADIDKPLQTFRTQFGETAWEAIERLGRMRGLIFGDSADGNLVGISLKQFGKNQSGATLVEGENILQIRAVLDDDSVRSKVAVVGQRQGSDEDGRAGTVSKDAAVATNPSARQGRDAYIIAEHPGDAEDFKSRADHEIARQIFSHANISIVVQGWFKPGGTDLWRTIESSTIYSPSTLTSDDGRMTLPCRQTTFLQDAFGGTKTALEFCLPQDLTSLPDTGASPDLSKQGTAQPSYDRLDS